MDVVEIRVDLIHPNPWNVNRVDPGMMAKLKQYLKREGLVQPLVVRAHPDEVDAYQLIGGEHRWRICKEELGYETVPCVVVELDDKRAKVLSVNLNSMSGETVPSLLSKLLSDLNSDMPIADMQALLPWDEGEIEDTLALMQLPEGWGDEIEKEAEGADAEAPTVVTLVLNAEQRDTFETAIAIGIEAIGHSSNPRADAAARIATVYLELERRDRSQGD